MGRREGGARDGGWEGGARGARGLVVWHGRVPRRWEAFQKLARISISGAFPPQSIHIKLLTLSRFSSPPLILELTAYRLWKDSGKLTSAPHSLLGSSPLSASFRRRVVRGIGFHRRLESLTAGRVPVTRTAAVAPAVPPPQRPSTRPIEAAKHYRSRRASLFRNNRI